MLAKEKIITHQKVINDTRYLSAYAFQSALEESRQLVANSEVLSLWTPHFR